MRNDVVIVLGLHQPESADLTRRCLSDVAHQLNTPIAFVAPLFSFYLFWYSISDRKTCGIHTCFALEPSIVDMAVGKRRILGMLYVAIDLITRRPERFGGDTRSP